MLFTDRKKNERYDDLFSKDVKNYALKLNEKFSLEIFYLKLSRKNRKKYLDYYSECTDKVLKK